MEATTIVRRPLVTEKASFASAEHNRYLFEVDMRATKTQVRKAIEELYEVKVDSVATQVRRGKVRRTKFGWRQTPTVKRAIVKVKEGDRIELF